MSEEPKKEMTLRELLDQLGLVAVPKDALDVVTEYLSEHEFADYIEQRYNGDIGRNEDHVYVDACRLISHLLGYERTAEDYLQLTACDEALHRNKDLALPDDYEKEEYFKVWSKWVDSETNRLKV